MQRVPRVAVIGAGIMGSSLALYLARREIEVTLIDASPAPFSCASRWNEGKIHLGYLYSGDPTMETAKKVLPGGIAFKPLVEELIGCPLQGVTSGDDVYLVHRDSVVEAAQAERYLRDVAALVRQHPDARGYLVDVSRADVRAIDRTDLAAIADPDLVLAGFHVPERSISTGWLADRFVEAVAAERRVLLRPNTRVDSVRPNGLSDKTLVVRCQPVIDTHFDAVINAAWEGGPAIDASLFLSPEGEWSHRYRLALFVRTKVPVRVPSILFAVGPFGDIKNYDDHHFYLSWYPAGLVVEGQGVDPPTLPSINQAAAEEIKAKLAHGLRENMPVARVILAAAEEIRLEGGWVFAIGRGSLADRGATIHRRDRYGIRRKDRYFSVDTGKYSAAPALARRLADEVAAVVGA